MVPVGAPRHRGAPGALYDVDREHLVHLEAIGVEERGRAGHVQLPHPGATLADHGRCAGPVRVEVRSPKAERARVVLAQGLDVAHLEARRLHGVREVADLVQLAIGKNVPLHEPTWVQVGALASEATVPGRPADLVVEQAALGP